MRFIFRGRRFGFVAIVLAVFLTAELAVRLFGFLNFPLYLNSRELGYIPAPGQHGSYLNRNEWAFNELSMGVSGPFDPHSSTRNILLIGDSIVLGGNPVPQQQRVGPLLNLECPQVWPISAGSWAFLNELRYVRMHENLLTDISRIIFVLNSEDFGDASVWTSEITHPTEYPLSGLLYLIRKYLGNSTEARLPVGDNNWRKELDWLLSKYDGPLTVILYPDRTELRDKTVRATNLESHAAELLSDRIAVLNLADHPSWSEVDYRDSIHPTVDGSKKLAEFIRRGVPECNKQPTR